MISDVQYARKPRRSDVFHALSLGGGSYQWRYSSAGQTNWINLNGPGTSIKTLQFGDFDGDGKTDVVSVAPEQGQFRWRFSSGGVANWRNMGRSHIPLADLRFGDFDAGEGCTITIPNTSPANADFTATPIIGTTPI
ncbi:MAG: hypothetical protein DWQ04_29420 [Chloroflexi bacterium]|nr:MAG: hypothetical protein DWQ04_29420 [Chloroflexota bacterium]